MYKMREYQEAAVNAAFNFLKYREGNGYVKSPGGSGKSVMIAKLAEKLYDFGFQVVILARNEKLLTQNKAKLSDAHQSVSGIYCAGLGEKDLSKPITIASAQSIVSQKLDEHIDRDLIALVDECDEINPNQDGDTQYWKFFRNNGLPRIMGFTATDFRTASGLIKWGEKVADVPINDLIERGYILPPTTKCVGNIDLSQVKVSMGEYNEAQLATIYEDPALLEESMKYLLQYGEERKSGLVFCQSLRHCDMIADSLEKSGQACMSVSGDTPKDELSFVFDDFMAGKFKYLVNCQLLTVGVDLPCIDFIAMFFATKSKRKFEQVLYRGTRLYDGKKDFLVLDMGNNFSTHGALGSPYRGDNKEEGDPKKGRICPMCETWVEKSNAEECPDCGYVFIKQEAPKVNHDYAPAPAQNPVYTGDIEQHEVLGVSYKSKLSKSGNEMIIVNYHCDYGQYGTIAEFLLPYHDSDFVRGKVQSFFKDRGVDIGNPMDWHMEQLVFEAEKLKQPSSIIVDHSEKFPRVKQYIWGGDEVQQKQSIDEILDGDEVSF